LKRARLRVESCKKKTTTGKKPSIGVVHFFPLFSFPSSFSLVKRKTRRTRQMAAAAYSLAQPSAGPVTERASWSPCVVVERKRG